MPDEALAGLVVRPGGRYVDATAGLGGHTERIAEASAPDGRVLAIDRDPGALELARERLARFGERVILARGDFATIAEICAAHGFAPVDGVLIDAGVSSYQLESAGRGFSFQLDEPLDMRMDPDGPLTAADVVNDYDEERLAAVIYRYGEEPRSRRVARAIVERRPLASTAQLRDAVEAALGRGRGRIHPATQTFQAIRIEVNDEIEQLKAALGSAESVLRRPGGRLVVISFHSLEDREAKNYISTQSRDCICPPRQPVCTCGHVASLRPSPRRVLRPSEDEVRRNPRARSARMRVAEALEAAA
jgi:16S rRNA (cytosine1402-N4)-methyltransferase